MKSLQVIRTHFSPYHGPHFEQNERDSLEKCAGVVVKNLEQADPNLATVLITNTHSELKKIPAPLLKQTQLILHSNSGYDQMAGEHDFWKDIPVLVGHEIRAQAVAEYSLSAVFQGLVELPQHLMWSQSRTWERPLLRDQKILVYGYGHIGKIVTHTLRALGAEVSVIDPFIKELPSPSFNSQEARIVIACASLNKTSRHMFNAAFFEKAHSELIFINGARGKLVEEKALREFLLTHPKAQAFLDVFENEPFGSDWTNFPQVWKTSHIAGVFTELDQEIISFEQKALNDFIQLNESQFKEKYKSSLLQNKWIQGELI